MVCVRVLVMDMCNESGKCCWSRNVGINKSVCVGVGSAHVIRGIIADASLTRSLAFWIHEKAQGNIQVTVKIIIPTAIYAELDHTDPC